MATLPELNEELKKLSNQKKSLIESIKTLKEQQEKVEDDIKDTEIKIATIEYKNVYDDLEPLKKVIQKYPKLVRDKRCRHTTLLLFHFDHNAHLPQIYKDKINEVARELNCKGIGHPFVFECNTNIVTYEDGLVFKSYGLTWQSCDRDV